MTISLSCDDPNQQCIKFTVTKRPAAFMISQSSAKQRYISPHLLSDHVRKHRDRWFRRAREIGYTKILPDDLLLITGFVKTRLWALGAIPSVRREYEYDLEIIVKGEMTDDPKELLDMSEVSKPCYVRSGPTPHEQRLQSFSKRNQIWDQAIFLSYLKAKTRLLGPLQVKAYAESRKSPPYNQDGRGDRGVLNQSDQSTPSLIPVSNNVIRRIARSYRSTALTHVPVGFCIRFCSEGEWIPPSTNRTVISC